LLDSIPLYSEDLIRQLDEAVPQRLPKINESEREMFDYRGRRHLINQLKALLAEREHEEFRGSM